MFRLLLLFLGLAAAEAVVCTTYLCEGFKRMELNCKGSLIKNGGFCGCTDACAKVEGEVCSLPSILLGTIPAGQCDEGLECEAPKDALNAVLTRGVCVQKKNTGERSVQTKCQQKRLQMLMLMVIWRGKWAPQCNVDGEYLPEQCDNNGYCFCVDKLGVMLNGTKVKGHISC